MMDSNWAEFWWNNITGANMVVSRVTEALHDTNLVILFVPDDLPWRYEMRTAIEYAFRKNASSENVLVQTIDAADDCDAQEPGSFLLDRFCTSRAIRTGYREGSTKTIQQYLIANKVLHDSIIWVKGFRPGQAEQWIKFCKGYKSTGVADGVFLLEIKDHISSGDLKSLSVVRFDDWITNYDVQLLNSFILDRGQGYSINWKKYISTLAACLCESDAEVSAELLSITDFSVDEPYVSLKRIDESGVFGSRGRDPKSNHVLALFRAGKNEDLRKRIWTAQVRVLFPLIELERVEYIRKYESEIQDALDNEEIRQYGEIISNPTEVEIGTLAYLVKSYRISMPSSTDRQRIDSLRHYRNTIAHMGCLLPNEVSDLLNYS